MMHAAILLIGLSAFGAGPKGNDVPRADVEKLAKSAGLEPQKFVEFAEACEECRPRALKALPTAIAKANERDDRSLLVQMQKDIFNRDKAAYPSLSENPNVGEIGSIRMTAFKVYEVVDKHTVRAMVGGEGINNDALTEYDAFITGIDTSKLKDDLVVSEYRCFRVTGNRKYKTVGGGSRTLAVLEPFDMAPVDEYLRLRYSKKKPSTKKK